MASYNGPLILLLPNSCAVLDEGWAHRYETPIRHEQPAQDKAPKLHISNIVRDRSWTLLLRLSIDAARMVAKELSRNLKPKTNSSRLYLALRETPHSTHMLVWTSKIFRSPSRALIRDGVIFAGRSNMHIRKVTHKIGVRASVSFVRKVASPIQICEE